MIMGPDVHIGIFLSGITFPNSQSQANLMKTIYNRCKLDVNKIAYVEAHSTGTKVCGEIK